MERDPADSDRRRPGLFLAAGMVLAAAGAVGLTRPVGLTLPVGLTRPLGLTRPPLPPSLPVGLTLPALLAARARIPCSNMSWAVSGVTNTPACGTLPRGPRTG